ncbi:protein of unknown function [Streptomyces sp. KY75]|nr:protein of unknown function [Streptomyces sp. KY75]CAD5992569.1 protein of unknown function [Streptomyces sp. KY70]
MVELCTAHFTLSVWRPTAPARLLPPAHEAVGIFRNGMPDAPTLTESIALPVMRRHSRGFGRHLPSIPAHHRHTWGTFPCLNSPVVAPSGLPRPFSPASS